VDRSLLPERKSGETFEEWKKRCFGIETLAEFKARVRKYETDTEDLGKKGPVEDGQKGSRDPG
jgi:hypothetical protein